jgi:predicted pyridoxine 5'-phosphate oxidase superfamily flavin-nucleotide-binding protein
VRILDDRTLLLPERPGNRLADSLRNVLENPRVGLLFVVPGVGDTLRVNGRGTITNDPVLLEKSGVEGKRPGSVSSWTSRKRSRTARPDRSPLHPK